MSVSAPFVWRCLSRRNHGSVSTSRSSVGSGTDATRFRPKFVFRLWIALGVAQIAAYLAGVKRWLGIRSVAGRSVCCNFDDFGRILAAEMFGRLIGEAP
jgi:hypothetical protein